MSKPPNIQFASANSSTSNVALRSRRPRLRPGEALGLTWSDVDWKRKVLHIEWQLQALSYKEKRNPASGLRVPDGYAYRQLMGRRCLVELKSNSGRRDHREGYTTLWGTTGPGGHSAPRLTSISCSLMRTACREMTRRTPKPSGSCCSTQAFPRREQRRPALRTVRSAPHGRHDAPRQQDLRRDTDFDSRPRLNLVQQGLFALGRRQATTRAHRCRAANPESVASPPVSPSASNPGP